MAALTASKQDYVTLPNGKSTSKLLFEALVVFFSTELTDENAKTYLTEFRSVQRWRTTRKAPQTSRLEDCENNTRSKCLHQL